MANHLNFPEDRRNETKRRRVKAADFYEDQPLTHQANNHDKQLHQVYSKGLKHDDLGVVTQSSYNSLLKALDSGNPADFETIEVGFPVPNDKNFQKLTDPQAGLAFDTEGPDCFQFSLPPAPTFASRETMGEMAEDYWMALLRDVAFVDYPSNSLAQQAADHLTTFGADFKGPKAMNKVTPGTLFRADLDGALTGPYLSQFLVWDVPYGSQVTEAKVAVGLPPSKDYLVSPIEYVKAQNGFVSARPQKLTPSLYLRSGREVSHYVHIDELFQGYLNACLLLITPAGRGGFEVPAAAANPYTASTRQSGFGTLGEPNFKVLVAEVATRALKAVWYQKWVIHRRLRPEVFGARIHFQKTGGANYNLDLTGMDPLLDLVKQHNATLSSGGDSYLLPMAYPEGSPTHPSYGAGHATVAGACVTLLKALFNTSMTFRDLNLTPKVIESSGERKDHKELDSQLTILGELNKLAANVGLSRNIAGVHWRSDFTQSLKLGECIALNFLRETASTYNEDVSFAVPKFFGGTVTIHKKDPKDWDPSDFTCG